MDSQCTSALGLTINDLYFQKSLRHTLSCYDHYFAGSISYHNGYSLGGFAFIKVSDKVYSCFAYGRGRWITRDRIAEYLAYPFEQLKALVLTANIHKSNIRSLRIAMRFGFYVVDESAEYVSLQLTRKDWI